VLRRRNQTSRELKISSNRIISLATAGFLCMSVAFGAPATPPSSEATLERNFDALIRPDDLRDWMKLLAAQPNHVSSPHDKANADQILAWFKSWGWDAHIETFWVLYPKPISETLELVGPQKFKATLQEPPIPGDSSAIATDPALPAYVDYQRDGDVTAGLVFVNYGMLDDYKTLQRLGVSVRGKIVIARYGSGWRGLKPKLAQDHGAIGCIIYSDPAQDGYSIDETYPNGPMRPPHGVQRGSVLDMGLYPGDPLTPGIGATRDAKRLRISDAPTIMKIPVLPISYADAQVFLAALAGQVAPSAWRGALPITYRVGPGPALVHLAVTSDWQLRPIYDVIATMKGLDLARSVGRPRQSPRRLGVRRHRPAVGSSRAACRSQGFRRPREAGLAAQAHDRLHELGRRGAHAPGLDRMGGAARKRTEEESGPLH